MEQQIEAERAEKKKKLDEQVAKGREHRHEKREQTRAERAAEREERIKQREVRSFLFALHAKRDAYGDHVLA